jgi:hypothetical protein
MRQADRLLGLVRGHSADAVDDACCRAKTAELDPTMQLRCCGL